jgi:hypothetical protein
MPDVLSSWEPDRSAASGQIVYGRKPVLSKKNVGAVLCLDWQPDEFDAVEQDEKKEVLLGGNRIPTDVS